MFHPSERWFTRTLARRHHDRSLKANRRHPVLESLEDRVVLSVVDLTTAGSTGTINGAIFRQGSTHPAGSGVIQSFVRIQNTGVEQGYNTDARPYVDPLLADVDKTATFDHSLPLNTVPLVSIGGQVYLDFVLGINQDKNNPLLSLDQVQVFLESNPALQGSSTNTSTSFLGTPIYDTSPSTNWVKLNASLSSGNGGADMFMDIPLTDLPDIAFSGPNRTLPLASNQYVYLYSHFGTQILNGADTKNGGSANDGFEQWATPTLGTVASKTTTAIYLGATGTTPLPSPVPAFSTVHDSATVTGSKRTPTGTVTFLFYTTIDGTGTPAGAGTVTLDANGVANPSDAEGPLNPGNYSFKAVYNGDSTYLPSVSPVEPLTIAKASPTLKTTILSPTGVVTAGNVTVQDRATISGGSVFTGLGTVNFKLEDASNNVITGTTSSKNVTANGNYDTTATIVSLAPAPTTGWSPSPATPTTPPRPT